MTAEQSRLDEARDKKAAWKKWGPYLSERQWGTVREDYSESGDAWNYLSHDDARSRAYRWGEDGLAGISDDRQLLCFALALWNGKDPILKERLFGLTNSEGNHGEDVKEYYFYLDATPTHSYLKYLYKYPQAAYPYDDLVATNRKRSRQEKEYELIDTGVFGGDRYFDVFVEYGKAGPEDILIEVTVHNRGPESATLHLLPALWFRNTWSWGGDVARPGLRLLSPGVVAAAHPELGDRFLHVEGAAELLFTENETNTERLVRVPNRTPYVKDAIHNCIVNGRRDAVNPGRSGTKVAAHYELTVEAGGSSRVRLRLRDQAGESFQSDFDTVMALRRKEADEFYAGLIPASLGADGANVMRQALAGMIWSKQYYYYDVDRWLEERGTFRFKPGKPAPRNGQWHHMFNADVISMPDKWEYPWYAAWDLAFHGLALTLVDPDFGKDQLDLMLRSSYLHPSGQLPAYEWNFGDVNPPVHAWGTIFTYRLEKERRGQGDIEWLERQFHKLLLNFTWWVNRKDRSGSNVFDGGFLGLDNIGVFDRSAPLPTGGYLDQADGTAWMALFCQNMLEIATELSLTKPAYLDLVEKFLEHVLWITSSMLNAGSGTGMWDEADGFFYDVLRLPNGHSERLKVRSMVGLLPLCAVTVYEGELVGQHPEHEARLGRFLEARPELRAFIHDPVLRGKEGRRMSAVLNEAGLRRVLGIMLDEKEFLSPYGIRSISRYHAEHPYVLHVNGTEFRVAYLPGESDSGMFGGNSNWRGPIWLPVNGLIIRGLLQYYLFYGDDFKIEYPTGSGRQLTLYQVAEDIGRRLSGIFLRNEKGHRPVFGDTLTFQEDPHWRDLIAFHEYFHGDNGAGLGASHQTGWTGIIARLMHLFATTTPEQALAEGKVAEHKAGRFPALRDAACRRRVDVLMGHSPSLYQINTRVWLAEVSRRIGRRATLDDVPDQALDWMVGMGFDWVWLLSVWQTGEASRRVSLTHAEWRHEFEATLPELSDDDITGSGFAITGYTVHRDLGGDAALARLRERFVRRGLRLMLDFVPNHTALDHPWIHEHPEYFVSGTELQLSRSPRNFTWVRRSRGDLLLAHGRDPFFDGWPDTLQLNYGNPDTRTAMIGELLRIAGQCDGVRCDMAMLVLPEVFERTWGIPSAPFWPEAMRTVREQFPEFRFMAEVYWDLEWTLQQQGFDYTYDKRLYDRLREGRARPVREHLRADLDYQEKSARFLENHDEPRATAAFAPGMDEAAAIVTYLLPGLRFFHQGQFTGRRKRISPHLGRGPVETVDDRVRQFYQRLLAVLRRGIVRGGEWRLLEGVPAWAGNATCDAYLAFAWQDFERGFLVVVNYASHQSQCYLRLPFSDLAGHQWRLSDMMSDVAYDRDGTELAERGLYLDLGPWQYHVFDMKPADPWNRRAEP